MIQYLQFYGTDMGEVFLKMQQGTEVGGIFSWELKLDNSEEILKSDGKNFEIELSETTGNAFTISNLFESKTITIER